MKEPIVSLQNPRVKLLVKLREKSSERQKQGLFLIEGLREIALALEAGVAVREIFYCPDLISPADFAEFPAFSTFPDFSNDLNAPKAAGGADRRETSTPNRPRTGADRPGINGPDLRDFSTRNRRRAGADRRPAVQEVSLPVFEKITYRKHSGGLIALAEFQGLQLQDLKLSDNPFLIILEAVEKPGNLGAILRTADAARVDAVIVCDPKTDLRNPNVIRSSLGCLFTTQVVATSSDETLAFLEKRQIRSYAAALSATSSYHETDFSGPAALVMGTESTGLTDKWLNRADAQVKIPMRGKIDSLNVSTSCAILVFEAMRQRGFKD